MGGVIAKLLAFARAPRNGAKQSDVKMDLGGGDVVTATHAQGSGDDAYPLPGDYPVGVRVDRSGGVFVVGFVEPDAAQLAQAGERRLYSRSGQRAEVAQVWLKNDGTVLVSNSAGSYELRPDGSQRLENANGSYELRANGSQRSENSAGHYELRADGTVDVNTATIDPGGNIVATSVSAPSIVAAGKELAGHKHPIASGSSAPGPTGPNI